MRYKVLCAAAALLVAALVVASEPVGTQSPPEPEIGRLFPNAVGVPTPPQPEANPAQPAQPGDAGRAREDLGWAVDLWKDSYGGTGVAVGLGSGGSVVAEELLAVLDVRNEVFDLLDRDVELRAGGAWESESFDTSRLTGIGIKVAGDGPASCRTYWRWTRDETPLPDGPEVTLATRDAPRTGFGDVLGLEVRVGCEATGPSTLTDVKLLLLR